MDFCASRQTAHQGCGKSGFQQVFCKDCDIIFQDKMEICEKTVMVLDGLADQVPCEPAMWGAARGEHSLGLN